METILKRDWYKRLLIILAIVTGIMMISMPQRTAAENVQEKVQEQEAEAIINLATLTWHNFMHDPDLSGFRAHLKRVQGVLIFPRLMKGAFVFGVEGGSGVLFARDEKTGSWSEPAFYEISSASFGLQAGVETSEAILVIETIKGIESLLSSTIKLGADASAVIGPKGSGIEGATSMSKGNDFVTYARTKGAFIGLSLEGAAIRTRDDLNKTYYGSAVRPSDIVLIRNVKSNPQSQVLHQGVVQGASRKEK
jgi:lipid-binding SYLF domain-containing protein